MYINFSGSLASAVIVSMLTTKILNNKSKANTKNFSDDEEKHLSKTCQTKNIEKFILTCPNVSMYLDLRANQDLEFLKIKAINHYKKF